MVATKMILAILAAATAAAALRVPNNRTAMVAAALSHSASVPSEAAIKQQRSKIERLASGLQSVFDSHSAFAHTQIAPELKKFATELHAVLKETDHMSDRALAMRKLQAAQEGMAQLTGDATKIRVGVASQGPEPVPMQSSGPHEVKGFDVTFEDEEAPGGQGSFKEYVHDPTNFNIAEDGSLFFLSSGKAATDCSGSTDDWSFQNALGVSGFFANSATGNVWQASLQSPFGVEGPVGTNADWPKFARCDYLQGVHATGSFDAPGVKCMQSPAFSSSKPSVDGLYRCVMYYSVYMLKGDGEEKGAACIGRAVGHGRLNGRWIADDEPIYCSNLVMDENGMPTGELLHDNEQDWADATTQALGIDPDIFEGWDGSFYLVWGSHKPGGAQIALLSDDGFIDEDTEGIEHVEHGWPQYRMIANTDGSDTGEAPAVLPAQCGGENYYFLFWTWGRCCRGKFSTYETVMGRSTSPFGPYLDKHGKDMAVLGENGNPGGSIFLESEVPPADGPQALGTRYIGPGHVAFFEYSDDGTKTRVVTFHFYDGEHDGNSQMGARRVMFDAECWPYVDTQTWSASEYFSAVHVR